MRQTFASCCARSPAPFDCIASFVSSTPLLLGGNHQGWHDERAVINGGSEVPSAFIAFEANLGAMCNAEWPFKGNLRRTKICRRLVLQCQDMRSATSR